MRLVVEKCAVSRGRGAFKGDYYITASLNVSAMRAGIRIMTD